MTKPHLPRARPANKVEQADLKVSRKLVPAARSRPVRLLGVVSDLSDQEPLYAATAMVAAVGLVARDERLTRAGIEMLAAHLLATAVRGVIKQNVDRTRPIAAARRGRYELHKGERFESDLNSFPSGHTAGAVAVALSTARHFPVIRPVALGAAGGIAAAQVIRSKHFVTDVVGGAAIGWAAAALIGSLVDRAGRI